MMDSAQPPSRSRAQMAGRVKILGKTLQDFMAEGKIAFVLKAKYYWLGQGESRESLGWGGCVCDQEGSLEMGISTKY